MITNADYEIRHEPVITYICHFSRNISLVMRPSAAAGNAHFTGLGVKQIFSCKSQDHRRNCHCNTVWSTSLTDKLRWQDAINLEWSFPILHSRAPPLFFFFLDEPSLPLWEASGLFRGVEFMGEINSRSSDLNMCCCVFISVETWDFMSPSRSSWCIRYELNLHLLRVLLGPAWCV